MKAAVTGANGFVGSWLSEHLESAGDEVWRLGGPNATPLRSRDLAVDLRAPEAIDECLASISPEVLFHLAAVSDVASSAADPDHALAVAMGGTIHVLEAAAHLRPMPMVILASSAEAYGRMHGPAPIREDDPLRPDSIYGALKAGQEAVAHAFSATRGLQVTIVRLFNLVGPRQRPIFAIPYFADQLARIRLGLAEPPLSVGNLDARRDFTDVRDAVRALRMLATLKSTGIFNVASGSAHALREVLDILTALANIRVDVRVSTERLRRSDPAVVVGDSGRIHKETAWTPTIQFSQSISDVWEEAMARNQMGSPP